MLLSRVSRPALVLVVVLVATASTGCHKGKKHSSGSGSGADPVIFQDDFSTDTGWTSSDPDVIYRDAGLNQVRWTAFRTHPQICSHPIPRFSGDFTMEFRFNIEHAANNCHLLIGLSGSVTPTSTAIAGGLGGGLYAFLCWHGGGVPNHYYFASIWTEDTANVQFTPWEHDDYGSGPTAGAVVVDTGIWYRLILTRTGATVTIDVELDNGTPVGSITTVVSGDFPAFNYVWIGKLDDKDWPWMNGWLDDLKITLP